MNQLLQTILDFITQNPETATAITVGFLSLLSGTLQLFGLTAASKLVGTITVDLGRVMRLLKWALSLAALRRASRISAEMTKTMGPPLILIACLGALSLLNGCVGTLEETRGKLQMSHLMGIRTTPRDNATCQSLSSNERIWTGVATGGAILGGASGIATFPVDSHRGDQILAGVAIGSAVTAGVGLVLEQSYAREWQREGCGQ